MSTGHVPTLVDVDLLEGGSPRMRDGRVTRSLGMKLDFLTTANRAIRDYEEASRIASKADEGFDGFSTMDVGFQILGSRLNDIAVRAHELEDPVLIAILKSIGMIKDDVVGMIQMGNEDRPSRLMAGLCASKEDLTEDERRAIAEAVRSGVHHDPEWTLAMSAGQTRDMDVLGWIAGCIEDGNMDSTFCPRAFVGRWSLHVRAES